MMVLTFRVVYVDVEFLRSIFGGVAFGCAR